MTPYTLDRWSRQKPLTLVTILLVIIIFNLLPTTAKPVENNNNKPNFLLIHLDDTGYGDIGFYSRNLSRGAFKGKLSISPQIDRMAVEGTVFSSYYSAACVCSPSRAGILTGRYPIRTSVFPGVLGPSDDRGLPEEEITIAEWLKDKAGYRTFAVGKWHLGHLEPYLPTFHGFERWSGMPYSHDYCPCPTSLTNTKDNLCRHWDPPCPLMNGTTVVQQPAILNDLVDTYVSTTIEYIAEALRDDYPFFGYYACQHTHHPQFAKKDNLGKSQSLGGRADAYGDAVWEMDDAVGRILDYLRANNLQEKTFVFLTSDNGAAPIYKDLSGMNSPLRCGKGTTWEGGQRVPFIAWGGTTVQGRVVTEMIAGMDLFPTISHLAGVSTTNFPRVLDGIDFSPLLTGSTKGTLSTPRSSFIYYGLSGSLDAVRIGKYKVHFKTSVWIKNDIEGCHPGQVTIGHQANPLVYDLEADVSESSPLSLKHPQHSVQVKLAHALVKEHRCTTTHLRSECDLSYSSHCFGHLRSPELWPPSPFSPYSTGKRACCRWGFDILVADWTKPSEYSCVRMNGPRHVCLHQYNLLCNPSLVLYPHCKGRAVCIRVVGDEDSSLNLTSSNTTCASESNPKECPEGWRIKYCATGQFQCRGTNEIDGGAVCFASKRSCENMYGGVAYSSKGCTTCLPIPRATPSSQLTPFQELHFRQPIDSNASSSSVLVVSSTSEDDEATDEVPQNMDDEGEEMDDESGRNQTTTPATTTTTTTSLNRDTLTTTAGMALVVVLVGVIFGGLIKLMQTVFQTMRSRYSTIPTEAMETGEDDPGERNRLFALS